MAKKKATAKKQDFASKFGSFMGNTLPGSGKRLGRLAKKVTTHTVDASQRFGKGFMDGYKEV